MALVSVIVPVYNVELYIQQCLDSLVNQTLFDIEIICVNDKTEDNSIQLIKDIYSTDPRISIYEHTKNMGLSAARNTGMSYAIGEFLYFMDSDDILDLNALEICYNIARTYKVDIVTFDAEVFFEDDDLRSHPAAIPRYDRQFVIKDCNLFSGRDFFEFTFNQNVYRPNIVLHFYRRDFIYSNNLVFKEGLLYEDELFTIQAYFSPSIITYCNNKFFKRRIRANSIMTKQVKSKNIFDLMLISDYIFDMIKLETHSKYRLVLKRLVLTLIRETSKLISRIDDIKSREECLNILKKSSAWNLFLRNELLEKFKYRTKNFIKKAIYYKGIMRLVGLIKN